MVLCNYLVLCFFLSARLVRNIEKFRETKYFTDHRTARAIQLTDAIEENFLVYSFTEQVTAKGNYPETS